MYVSKNEGIFSAANEYTYNCKLTSSPASHLWGLSLLLRKSPKPAAYSRTPGAVMENVAFVLSSFSSTNNPDIPKRVFGSVNTMNPFFVAGEKKLMAGVAAAQLSNSIFDGSFASSANRGLSENVSGRFLLKYIAAG